MSSKTDALPFPIGRTWYQGRAADLAADVAAGTLTGGEFLGRIYEVEDINYASTATVKPLRSNARRKVMAVRNVSGATLARKRLVSLEISTTLCVTSFDGYGWVLYQQRCYPIDEFIGTAGVADDDICWVVVEGPATCTNGAAVDTTEEIADGDALVVKAGTSATNADAGRVVKIDTTATDLPASAHIGLVGYSMGVRLTTEVTSDILVNIRQHH